jgi:hypothetical protein
MSSDRTDKARRFLANLLPERTLESLHPVSGTEAPPPSRVPSEYQGATESAAVKVATGQDLTPPERFALEAIISRCIRAFPMAAPVSSSAAAS